jgi:hypothetical protein
VTSRVIRKGGELQEIVISCDQMSCDVAKNNVEIADGGGLRAMGWQTTLVDGSLRHYCPEHIRP